MTMMKTRIKLHTLICIIDGLNDPLTNKNYEKFHQIKNDFEVAFTKVLDDEQLLSMVADQSSNIGSDSKITKQYVSIYLENLKYCKRKINQIFDNMKKVRGPTLDKKSHLTISKDIVDADTPELTHKLSENMGKMKIMMSEYFNEKNFNGIINKMNKYRTTIKQNNDRLDTTCFPLTKRRLLVNINDTMIKIHENIEEGTKLTKDLENMFIKFAEITFDNSIQKIINMLRILSEDTYKIIDKISPCDSLSRKRLMPNDESQPTKKPKIGD
jgi:hypothetical protein